MSFYDELGGEPTFRKLVDVFYDGVAADPLLRPMYPEEDLTGAKDRFALFLMQYWGGPSTYSETRGHPRLRMRHAPFPVTVAARDAWLGHMRRALDSLQLSPLHDATFWDYVERAAYSLVNSTDGRSPLAAMRETEQQAVDVTTATIGPETGGRNGLGIAAPPRSTIPGLGDASTPPATTQES